MALVDVFFTPSILITLAVCLILISVLGLYFIQKINQQNHKINTMVDLVATLSEQMNMLRTISPLPNNVDIGGSSLSTDNTPITQNDQPAMLSTYDTHTVNMVDVSDNEEGSSGSDIEYDESDEEDSDDGEEDSDEEEDSDDEEESDEEKDNKKDVLSVQPVEIGKIDDDILEIPELSADEIDEPLTMKSIAINIEDDEDDEDDEGDEDIAVKTLDVVMDYKKASLTKLREIVQSKGLVSDASKMKKADILRVLESE